MEKGRAAHTETPPWDERPRMKDDIDGAVQGIYMFTTILAGVVSGDIGVEPASAWGDMVFSFSTILQMMMMGM